MIELGTGSIFSLIAGTAFSADAYQVETGHSFINFKVKRAGFRYVAGRFNGFNSSAWQGTSFGAGRSTLDGRWGRYRHRRSFRKRDSEPTSSGSGSDSRGWFHYRPMERVIKFGILGASSLDTSLGTQR